MDLSLDPVKIVHYSFVSYDYFEHLYLSNINFYKEVRRIIQAAKQDYSLLMEKSIRYERIYKNEKFRALEKKQPLGSRPEEH